MGRQTYTYMVVGMIRDAMSKIYDNEYDAVIATVRIYAMVGLLIFAVIISVLI